MPFVEHVHALRVFHPFPHQELLPLYAAADSVEHRTEHDKHAQQAQLRHRVVVDQARNEDAQGYPRLRGHCQTVITADGRASACDRDGVVIRVFVECCCLWFCETWYHHSKQTRNNTLERARGRQRKASMKAHGPIDEPPRNSSVNTPADSSTPAAMFPDMEKHPNIYIYLQYIYKKGSAVHSLIYQHIVPCCSEKWEND